MKKQKIRKKNRQKKKDNLLFLIQAVHRIDTIYCVKPEDEIRVQRVLGMCPN